MPARESTRAPARRIPVTRRVRLLGIAAIALAVGVVSWGWGELAWPGRAVVRGHVGDAGAAALVYVAIALTGARRSIAAILALTVAVAIEVAQRGAAPASEAEALVLGAHFDPWDLLAYAVGVAAAAACDRR